MRERAEKITELAGIEEDIKDMKPREIRNINPKNCCNLNKRS